MLYIYLYHNINAVFVSATHASLLPHANPGSLNTDAHHCLSSKY